MTTGRNFKEILRTIDSMQRTQNINCNTCRLAPGDDVIIVPKVTNEAKNLSDEWKP